MGKVRQLILEAEGTAVEVANRLGTSEHYVRRVRRTADPDAYLAWHEINREYERDRYRHDAEWRAARLRNGANYRAKKKAEGQ